VIEEIAFTFEDQALGFVDDDAFWPILV